MTQGPNSKDVVGMLDDLLAAEEGLTDWEVRFIESLDKQRDFPFSDKQIATLKKICDERL